METYLKKRLIPHSESYPRRIYGIDFSGAADAGKRMWITHGIIKDSTLWIKDCERAETLLASGNERHRCTAALRDFIMKERVGAFGIDFPFGLPQDLVKDDCWEDFILSFPYRYPNAEEFKKILYSTSGNSELKRITDRENQTPFSPYNLRLYRQTYFGIREVLFPLIQDRLVCVLPMQKAVPGKAWLLEICPASTLKQEHLYFPYKGRTKTHYQARMHILAWIEEACTVSLPRPVRSAVLKDYSGDALDSIIAAFSTFRAIYLRAGITGTENDAYLLEGYVYV